MASIIHITADFPDAFNPRKTEAVKRLVHGADRHTHFVYSLNRINGLGGIELVGAEGNVVSLAYRAPPYGIGHRHFLGRLSEWICKDIAARGLQPDGIHAHKLTIDGVIGARVARETGASLLCGIWGNTDQKILRYRPDLHHDFAAVTREAACLLPATPWIADHIRRTFPGARDKIRTVPILSEVTDFMPSEPSERGFVSIFNLDDFRNKNVERLIKALKQLHDGGRPITLDIYGGGSEASVQHIQRAIDRLSLSDHVRLCGPIPHSAVLTTINQHQGFVLPSRRETFGMVFVEALFAGVPVIYPRRQAIDGFFEPQEIGYACDPGSVQDIAAGLTRVLETERELKANIEAMQKQSALQFLSRDAILGQYQDIYDAIAPGSRSNAPVFSRSA